MSYEENDNAMRLENLNINLNDELRLKKEFNDNEILKQDKIVRRYKSLQNLLKNQDFIDVIIDGFLKEKSEKIFAQLVTPKSHRSISEEDCISTLNAISMINKYIGYNSINGDLYYESVRAKEILEDIIDLKF